MTIVELVEHHKEELDWANKQIMGIEYGRDFLSPADYTILKSLRSQVDTHQAAISLLTTLQGDHK